MGKKHVHPPLISPFSRPAGVSVDRRFVLFGLLSGAAAVLPGCSGAQLADGSDPATTTGAVYDFGLGDDPNVKVFIPASQRKPPTMAELMKPGPLRENTMGRKDAPVTIVEYASHTCPYCRVFHTKTFPKLKQQYIDTGKVYFILREFPIGHASGTASIVNKCAPPGQYFKLFHAFMRRQGEWVSQEVRTDKIFKIGQSAGLTPAQMNSCLKDKKLVAGLSHVKDRARTFGVFGTPTFFINGKNVRGILTYKAFEAKINPLLG